MAPKVKILKNKSFKNQISKPKLYIKNFQKSTKLNSEKFSKCQVLKNQWKNQKSLKKLFFLTKNNFFSFLLRLSSSQKGSCLNFLDLYKLCPKNRIFFISKTNQTLMWWCSLTASLTLKSCFSWVHGNYPDSLGVNDQAVLGSTNQWGLKQQQRRNTSKVYNYWLPRLPHVQNLICKYLKIVPKKI